MEDGIFKVLQERHFAPIAIQPGDSIRASIKKGIFNREEIVVEETFTEHRNIDTIIVFEIDELLGMKNVVGAVFGESL